MPLPEDDAAAAAEAEDGDNSKYHFKINFTIDSVSFIIFLSFLLKLKFQKIHTFQANTVFL
jgi:hypothetical protein